MSCAQGRVLAGTKDIVCLMEGESLSADVSEKCKCTPTDNSTVTVCHTNGYKWNQSVLLCWLACMYTYGS